MGGVCELQVIDIPRFDFIEVSKASDSECREHIYFVTTDVNQAADHYLHNMIGEKPIYMKISSIDGKVCIAKSYGLSHDHTHPIIIKEKTDLELKSNVYHFFTDGFIETVEKKLS